VDFLSHIFLYLSVTNCHVNVTGWLADAVAAAFCAGCETLERGTFFNVDGFHLQFVDVSTVVVFSVSNGRLQNFLDNARSFFLRECQDVQSLVNFFCRESCPRPNGLCRPTDGRP